MDAYLKDQFDFTGVKAALLVEQSILVILRDNKPDIPWPNTWELPGGGREGQETPLECLQREVWEELGLTLTEESIIWSKIYPSMLDKDRSAVFVVGRISQEQYREIRFGDEGQEFKLMPVEDFIKAEGVIPQLQERETIIAIQRASFKAVYDKYQDEYDPYLEDRERIKWKLVERPNSYYYFVKDNEEKIGFLRVQTNEELTEAWLGTAAILPQYQGKGYGSEGLRLLEMEFPTVTQWDLCTVLQDAGMVTFYEKNGYRQTHIEPEKEGMDMVYMKKMIEK